MRYEIVSILPVLLTLSWAHGGENTDTTRDLADILGSSHVAGKYSFSDKDFLNEGADVLLDMGSRVIKLWFTDQPGQSYPFNSQWPEVRSLVELAKTTYYREVFAKPFTTYILEAFSPARRGSSGPKGISNSSILFLSRCKYGPATSQSAR